MDLSDRRAGRWMALIRRWSFVHVLFILLQTTTGEQNSVSGSENRTRRLIRVATIQIEPYVHLNWSPGLIANERYEGLFIDLLKEIAEEARFAYQLYLVPDGKTGQLGDNGHWNGLIGELERGSADIALAPMVATDERRQAVNFMSPLSLVNISLLSRDHGNRHLPYGVVLHSEALYALKTNHHLYNSIKRHGILYASSIMEGLDKAREGLCNLLLNAELADYYADREPCDLTAEHFHAFPSLFYSIATSQVTDVSRQVGSVIDRLIERGGLMERLEQRWLRGKCMRKGTLPTSLGTTVNTDTQKMWTKLYVTSVVVEPYLMRSNKRGVEFEGYIADLVHQIARVLSVDYEWRVQRRVGRRRKDGSWTGMIGELLEGKADLAAAPFILEDDQEALLSFSKPFLESTLSLVIKAPTDNRDVPIVMIEDLLNQSSYDFGVVHKSRLAKQLRQSPLPLYKQLWRRLKEKDEENRISSIKDGLRRVREGQFALVMESPEATYLASKRPCDLLSLSQYLAVMHYTFATLKNSPLVEHLNLALLQLQEEGVLQALFHKWWNADECTDWDDRKQRWPEPQTSSTSVAPTLTSTTIAPTPAPLKPLLDFDLDKLLGLSTEQYPYVGNDTDYDVFDDAADEDLRDMERIFLTSPISAFTPRGPAGDVIAEPTYATENRRRNEFSTSTSTSVHIVDVEDNGTAPTEVGDRSANTITVTSLDGVNNPPTDATVTSTVSSTSTSNIITTTIKRKSRRKGRKRRPKKRKGRRRGTTTPTVITSSSAHNATQTSNSHAPRSRSREFNRNIDWFFVTQLPRPEEYDDYDSYNASNDVNVTSNTPDRMLPAVPSSPEVRTTPNAATEATVTRTNATVRSAAPPDAEVSTAVLVVVVVHLVIFGWPPATQGCHENCDR